MFRVDTANTACLPNTGFGLYRFSITGHIYILELVHMRLKTTWGVGLHIILGNRDKPVPVLHKKAQRQGYLCPQVKPPKLTLAISYKCFGKVVSCINILHLPKISEWKAFTWKAR